MQSLLHLISAVIGIYTWVIFIQVILSWLIAFKVINLQNQFVYTLSNVFYRLTEPALQPIRRFMPNLGSRYFAGNSDSAPLFRSELTARVLARLIGA